ncbi:hypothetical protein [Chryseobacterium wangxinyae]|uniref:hypothetical protein n=1 Tax=unclassified Chryseobacterium TaxID=2593645 RepID=UPI0022708C45|nr:MULTISPECIES: hypothetical protein [unclassified Chryseobacterium]MCY0970247.1 hypothetical protein [Chryseobacterium sp. CY353]MCY0977445.1 hypothetical protein [Chryseobacterium sp. CY350]WBZ95540.1 hypothetical protein PGH12_19045 [Chryseobacterium sp. CY350]
MKKLLYSLLIFASATLFAQKNPNVKFAICNDAVGTVAMFDLKKDFVQSVNVFKTKSNLPQNLKKFDFLADNGLAEVKFKKDVGTLDFMTLGSYNAQSGLPQDASVFIEGYEFKNPDTKIFADMIADAKVETVEGKKALVITTVKK